MSPAKKSTTRNSTAKKPASKKSAGKKSASKKPASKLIGSARSRRRVRDITTRVLAHVKDDASTEAAPILGVGVADVRNMRQGNKVSVPILLKMIRVGRFDPRSIIEGPKLRKLRSARSVRGAQQRLVDARVCKLACTRPGKEWVRLTGLSIRSAYGLRSASGAHVTLYTLLGFLDAGHTIDELIFGS